MNVELMRGQQVTALIGEPAAMPLGLGQAVRVSLPADAFMMRA
jgi:hypothetical protein